MKPNLRVQLNRHATAVYIGLLILLLSGVCVYVFHSREPVYQGRQLSTWVRQLNEGDAAQRQEAAAALHALEDLAIPILIARLEPRDEHFRAALVSLTSHFPSCRDKYISVEMDRGYSASALGILGPSAVAAIPGLICASRETNSFCAARAKAALIQIQRAGREHPVLPPAEIRSLTDWLRNGEILLTLGSNIQSSADEMVAAIGQDNAKRFDIVEALGWNRSEPNASVLLLRGLLRDKESGIRANTLNMLMLQRVFARDAYGEIAQRTNDPDVSVRENAKFALMFEVDSPMPARAALPSAKKVGAGPLPHQHP